WTSGAVGSGALNLDGASGYVTTSPLAGMPTGNAAHTIAAWVKVNALPPNRAWLRCLGNPGLGAHHWLINSAGYTQFGEWSGQTLHPQLATGQWTHVAMTYTQGTLSAYVNGVLVGTTSGAFNLLGTPLILGKPGVAGESYFNGQIDGLHIY